MCLLLECNVLEYLNFSLQKEARGLAQEAKRSKHCKNYQLYTVNEEKKPVPVTVDADL